MLKNNSQKSKINIANRYFVHYLIALLIFGFAFNYLFLDKGITESTILILLIFCFNLFVVIIYQAFLRYRSK